MHTALQAALVVQLRQCVALLQQDRSPGACQNEVSPNRQDSLVSLLSKMDVISQKELVNVLDSGPTSVKDLISRLESLEPTDRRQSESDRRQIARDRRQIAGERRKPLPPGTSAPSLSAIGTLQVDMIGEAFLDFTEEEIQQFAHLLSKLLAGLQNIYGTPE